MMLPRDEACSTPAISPGLCDLPNQDEGAPGPSLSGTGEEGESALSSPATYAQSRRKVLESSTSADHSTHQSSQAVITVSGNPHSAKLWIECVPGPHHLKALQLPPVAYLRARTGCSIILDLFDFVAR
jgi:hypothetical protein